MGAQKFAVDTYVDVLTSVIKAEEETRSKWEPSKRTRAWHKAFAAWYDHDEAGHRVRAFLWGQTADALVWLFDTIGWGTERVVSR